MNISQARQIVAEFENNCFQGKIKTQQVTKAEQLLKEQEVKNMPYKNLEIGLGRLIKEKPVTEDPLYIISNYICDYFRVPREMPFENSRKTEVVELRRIIIYLATASKINNKVIAYAFSINPSDVIYHRDIVRSQLINDYALKASIDIHFVAIQHQINYITFSNFSL